MEEVAHDLKAIFKVRREKKSARALAEEFIGGSTGSVFRGRLRCLRPGSIMP